MRFSSPYIGSSAIAGRFDRACAAAARCGRPERRRPHSQDRLRSRRPRIAGAAAGGPAGLSRSAYRAGAGAAAAGLAGRDRDIDRGRRSRYSVTITGSERAMPARCRCRCAAMPPRRRPRSCSMSRSAARPRRRWSAPSAVSRCRMARSTSFPAAANCRSISAPATTPRATPRSPTCWPRSSGSPGAATSRPRSRKSSAARRCRARRGLQAQFAARHASAPACGRSHLPSGAGHDAVMFSGVTDVGMLFVRCGNGGISHSPLETITAADADLAARILLDTICEFRAQPMTVDEKLARSHRRFRRRAILRARPNFLPNWSRCRATIRPAIAPRMPRARGNCSKDWA